MKKNGLVWNFLETPAVETSDHTNKTNKYLHHPNNIPFKWRKYSPRLDLEQDLC